MNTLTENVNELKSYFANEINECEKLVEEQKDQTYQPVYLLLKKTGSQSKIKNIGPQIDYCTIRDLFIEFDAE